MLSLISRLGSIDSIQAGLHRKRQRDNEFKLLLKPSKTVVSRFKTNVLFRSTITTTISRHIEIDRYRLDFTIETNPN